MFPFLHRDYWPHPHTRFRMLPTYLTRTFMVALRLSLTVLLIFWPSFGRRDSTGPHAIPPSFFLHSSSSSSRSLRAGSSVLLLLFLCLLDLDFLFRRASRVLPCVCVLLFFFFFSSLFIVLLPSRFSRSQSITLLRLFYELLDFTYAGLIFAIR